MDYLAYGNITEYEANAIYEMSYEHLRIGGGWVADDLMRMISQARFAEEVERYLRIMNMPPIVITEQVRRKISSYVAKS